MSLFGGSRWLPAVVGAALALGVTGCGSSAPPAAEPAGIPATSAPVAPEPADESAAVPVMLLGDSITAGEYYRPALRRLLDEAGCEVRFVGSNRAGNAGGLAADHEGHGGWTAAQLAEEAGSWARAARPRVVLVQAGTNDLYQGHTPAATAEEVGRIVTSLRAADPEIAILVGTTPPGVGIEAEVDTLNAALRGFVLGEAGGSPAPLVLVEVAAGFDWRTDTVDEVHPNPVASAEMARHWFAALRPLLGSACPDR